MTDSAKTAHAQTPASANAVEEFGQKIISDDFAAAKLLLQAAKAEEGLQARFADILMIEIETRLEAADLAGAEKCLALLRSCAPDRVAEACLWLGDYHLSELAQCLSAGGIASFGKPLERLLAYAPHRKEEAYGLVGQYFMQKLKRAMNERKGDAAELNALREILRYAPHRKEEAYHLFAERCLDEMNEHLLDNDKEYAKLALAGFLKYAPGRKAEAMAIWERHLEAAKERKLYGILGVERTATDEEIKLAYRKLAKALHPDVNVGNAAAEEQMRHVNAAYTILGEPALRAQYDQRGDRRERR